MKLERDAAKNSKGTGANAGISNGNGRGWVGQNLEPAPQEDEEAQEKRTVSTRTEPHALPSKPNVPLPENEKRKKREVLPVGPEDCWFCLSNPQCAKHLIVAIGESSIYLVCL